LKKTFGCFPSHGTRSLRGEDGRSLFNLQFPERKGREKKKKAQRKVGGDGAKRRTIALLRTEPERGGLGRKKGTASWGGTGSRKGSRGPFPKNVFPKVIDSRSGFKKPNEKLGNSLTTALS